MFRQDPALWDRPSKGSLKVKNKIRISVGVRYLVMMVKVGECVVQISVR